MEYMSACLNAYGSRIIRKHTGNTEKEAQFGVSEIWGHREQLLNVNRVPSD